MSDPHVVFPGGIDTPTVVFHTADDNMTVVVAPTGDPDGSVNISLAGQVVGTPNVHPYQRIEVRFVGSDLERLAKAIEMAQGLGL